MSHLLPPALQAEIGALRLNAAVSRPALARPNRLVVVRVTGEGAWDFLDRVLPCELYLRDAQARPTVLLRPDGTILADVLVGALGDDLWLLVDGLDEASLLAWLADTALPGEAVAFRGLSDTHAIIGVDGPLAWATLEAAGHPGIGGMAYLTLAELGDGVLCARAGRTGEFGYLLVTPRAREAALLGRLAHIPMVSDAALDHCALESWVYDPHAPGVAGLTPIELQLQWRLSRRKEDVPGMAALAARRAAPDRRRTVALTSGVALTPGDPLLLEGTPVGAILDSRPWLGPRGGSIGVGLLPADLAHPGLDVFSVPGGPVRTVSAPFLVPRSLLIRPSRLVPDPATLPDPYL